MSDGTKPCASCGDPCQGNLLDEDGNCPDCALELQDQEEEGEQDEEDDPP